MDSSIYSYFGPFDEMPICGQTIWTIDMFETSPPPLMQMTDWTQHTTHHIHDSDGSHDTTHHIQHIDEHIKLCDRQDMDADIEEDMHYMRDIETNVISDELDDKHVKHKTHNTYNYYLEFGSGDCLESNESQQSPKEWTQESIDSSVGCDGKRENVNQIRFPYKLWKLVNECKTNAIKWSTNGESIVINYSAFQKQYLDSKNYFKTKNMCSFVRQLNLYGFYKVSQRSKLSNKSINETNDNMDSKLIDLHEFKNDYFRRNREDLLKMVYRRYSNKSHESNGKRGFISLKAYKRGKSNNNETKVKRRPNRRQTTIKSDSQTDKENIRQQSDHVIDCDTNWLDSLSQQNDSRNAFDELLEQTLCPNNDCYEDFIGLKIQF